MPTNLYGPNDNFSAETSHVIPGLLRRMYQSKINKENNFLIWGTGTPLREFLFVDDLASAIQFIIQNNITDTLINIGSGDEKTIKGFAEFIIKKLGINIKIKFDKTKPNGTPRKLLDTSIARKYGWRSKINLEQGFEKVYSSFLEKK